MKSKRSLEAKMTRPNLNQRYYTNFNLKKKKTGQAHIELLDGSAKIAAGQAAPLQPSMRLH